MKIYRVMIVDDESWVVESLKKGINWEEYGFQVVGWAFDGKEALDQVDTIKPDVIFTDIRMPVMSGLDLIKHMQQKESIKFVVVSGYAEFAYVQKALNYGVASYCLKPVDDVEVASVLKRLKRILDEKETAENTVMLDLMEDRMGSGKALEIQMQEAGLKWDHERGMRVITCLGDGNDVLSLDGKIFTFAIGLSRKGYIVPDTIYQNYMTKYGERLVEGTISIGVSSVFYKGDQTDNAIQEALLSGNQSFFKIGKRIFEYNSSVDHAGIKQCLHDIEEAVSKKDAGTVQNRFEKLKKMFHTGDYNVRHASFVYNMVMYFVSEKPEIGDDDFIVHYEELLDLFNDAYEMIDFLAQSILGYLMSGQGASRESSHHPMIEEIIQFVERNYFNDISLKDLSERFYVSPNYLCRIFKKATGKSLTTYITSLRIQYTCELLKNSKLPIHEISEKAGYENYFYFARIFKRTLSMTPSEFREQDS